MVKQEQELYPVLAVGCHEMPWERGIEVVGLGTSLLLLLPLLCDLIISDGFNRGGSALCTTSSYFHSQERDKIRWNIIEMMWVDCQWEKPFSLKPASSSSTNFLRCGKKQGKAYQVENVLLYAEFCFMPSCFCFVCSVLFCFVFNRTE